MTYLYRPQIAPNEPFKVESKKNRDKKKRHADCKKTKENKVSIQTLEAGVEANFNQIRDLITRVEALENPSA